MGRVHPAVAATVVALAGAAAAWLTGCRATEAPERLVLVEFRLGKSERLDSSRRLPPRLTADLSGTARPRRWPGEVRLDAAGLAAGTALVRARAADAPRWSSDPAFVRAYDDPDVQFEDRRSCNSVNPPARQRAIDAVRHGTAATGADVAIAIVDQGFDVASLEGAARSPSDAWPSSGRRATAHGSMVAYCAALVAPRATFIDIDVDEGPRRDLASIYEAYLHLADLLARRDPARRGLVIVNSWHTDASGATPAGIPPDKWGPFTDNPDHPFTRLVERLSALGADVVFAAGNCGSPCDTCGGFTGTKPGRIRGTAASPAVFTIGAVDGTGRRLPDSSEGPGWLPGAEAKPDFVAYAGFAGFAGMPMLQTSAAAAVAGGVIAATRSLPGFRWDATRDSAWLRGQLAAAADAGMRHTDGTAPSRPHDTEIGYGLIRVPQPSLP